MLPAHDRSITAWFASLILAALLALMLAAATAHADGDPASDVLLGENVFYPFSPPVSASLQRTLNAETVTARDALFPIKVALIQSPVDLGAISSLFDRPQQYASFLEQEISFQGEQPLLVVMPNGYGVQGLGAAAAAAAGSLVKPIGDQSDELADAAINAVKALATAAGHPIATSDSVSIAGSGDGSMLLVLVAGAIAAAAAAVALIAGRGRVQSSWADRVRSGGEYVPAAGRTSGTRDMFAYGAAGRTIQTLQVVGLILILGGLSWAIVRGLEFYGLTLVDVGYDLDQPPLLLVLVGVWLWYRSRR